MVRQRLLWARRAILGVLALLLVVAAEPWAQLLLLPPLALAAWRGAPRQLASAQAVGGFLAADGLLLLLGVAATGGAANPFVYTLLVYVVLAAMLLPFAGAALYALGAAAGYTLLLYTPVPHGGHAAASSYQWHLVGMWVNFCGGAALLTLVVWPLANALRARDQELARARETALRHEQVIAVGTLAASTLHALATPLATVQLQLEEWEADGDTRVRALHEPLARCRAGLEQLRRAGSKREPEPLSHLLMELRQHYRLAPDGALTFATEPVPAAQVAGDPSLRFALINLIDNALAAASHRVVLSCSVTPERIALTLDDDGPGMSTELLHRFGTTALPSRSGLGIGGLLANATIERLGGQVMVSGGAGGTRITVHLPNLAEAA